MIHDRLGQECLNVSTVADEENEVNGCKYSIPQNILFCCVRRGHWGDNFECFDFIYFFGLEAFFVLLKPVAV
jgi:hypothetical protein